MAMNITEVPGILMMIVKSALGLEEAAGGAAGSITAAMLNGIKRGLFSNEAGMGSAPNIAATATPAPHHPSSQGLVQAFGVFVEAAGANEAGVLPLLGQEVGSRLHPQRVVEPALHEIYLHLAIHQPNPPASQSLLYRLQILCNYYLPIVELEAQRIETRTELQEVLGPERTPTDNNTPEQASSQMIISDSENETDYDPAIGSTASSEHVIEALAGIFHPPPSTQFFIKAENIPRLLALAKQVKFVRLEDMLWSGGIYFTENAKNISSFRFN